MTIRTLHRVSMTGASSASVVGVMSGSPLLLGAGGLLLVVLIATSGRLFTERGLHLRIVVHGLTGIGFLLAVTVLPTARFDSVLLVVMLGLFNRFVLRNSQRDDFIILAASGVLMAATTVVTPSLAFVFVFAAFVVWVLWALLASQLASGVERSTGDMLGRPAPRTQAFLAATGLSFMLVGYALFSLFPRYNFARFLGAGAFLTIAGASDTMELERGGIRSPGRGMVVMRVEPVDGSRATLEGLYARLYALDRFDGARFYQDRRGPRLPLYWRDREAEPRPAAVRARVRLLRTESRGTLHPIAALGRAAPAKVELRNARTRLDGTWMAKFRNNALSLDYSVSLSDPGPTRALAGSFHARSLARAVALPDDLDPRLLALSTRLTAGRTDDDAKIGAVLMHFAGGYRYSLESPGGASDDPLVRFVFETKAGHCELYAAAVAVLLRAAGIPARVATGYYGGYWNRAGGYLEMSDEDAHAWVEAYDRDRGWRWVDATPESERSGARREKVLAFVRDVYDRLEALWYEHVVDFDERQRQRIVGAVAARFARDDLDAWLGLTAPFRATSRPFGFGVFVLVLLIGGAVALRVGRGRRSVGRAGARLYRLLDGPADRYLTFGVLLARAPEGLRRAAGPVVADYEAFRYGGGARSGATSVPRALDRRIRQLGRTARSAKRGARVRAAP